MHFPSFCEKDSCALIEVDILFRFKQNCEVSILFGSFLKMRRDGSCILSSCLFLSCFISFQPWSCASNVSIGEPNPNGWLVPSLLRSGFLIGQATLILCFECSSSKPNQNGWLLPGRPDKPFKRRLFRKTRLFRFIVSKIAFREESSNSRISSAWLACSKTSRLELYQMKPCLGQGNDESVDNLRRHISLG